MRRRRRRTIFARDHSRRRWGHLHLAAMLSAVVVGGVLAVALVRPGESAPEPAAEPQQAAQEPHDAPPARMSVAALVAPDVYGALSPRVAGSPRPETDDLHRQVEVARGDTLMKVLLKAGVARGEAHRAIAALTKKVDARRIRPGQKLSLRFETDADGEAAALQELVFHASVEKDVRVTRAGDGFQAQTVAHTLDTRHHRAIGRIDSSLFLAAERARLPVPVILDLISLYSFDVDFQRDIQPGDGFEVLFESEYTADGDLARHGNIIYAQLTVSGHALPLYRFQTDGGRTDYFNDKGHSVRKALMKTPVDGARLSSRFGMRRHPILGYRKKHRGIDFAAPRGTPVMAAGNGTVEVAGRNGAYGRYIRIRHNGEYQTAYTHLSKYARGIRKGRRVRQGEVIGYVGSSGRSTGPHLHYEVLRRGRQINPMGLKLPTGRKLKGAELARFQDTRKATHVLLASAPRTVDLAQND